MFSVTSRFLNHVCISQRRKFSLVSSSSPVKEQISSSTAQKSPLVLARAQNFRKLPVPERLLDAEKLLNRNRKAVTLEPSKQSNTFEGKPAKCSDTVNLIGACFKKNELKTCRNRQL